MKIKWLIPLAVVIIFELTADVFSKEWSLRDKWWLAAIGIIEYMVSNIFWLASLKSGAGLGRGVIIFSIASALIAAILGYFIYHEPVTTIQAIGVVIGIISIAFLVS